MATIRLKNVFLHVTKACNLRCSYCYFSADRPLKDEMAAYELAGFWPELAELQPQRVVFTGGEPLLRSDIFDLLCSLRGADPLHNILRCINTNGHLVTQDLATHLIGLVDEVRVSLDGLAEINDNFRGKGNFRAVMRALEIFHSVGFEPTVLITITSVNLHDLPKLLNLLVEKNIMHIKLNSFRPIGRGSLHHEWSVSRSEIQAILHQEIENGHPDWHLASDFGKNQAKLNCGVGSFLSIMPNGDVFPCHVLTNREFRCGNIREQSLLEICSCNGFLGRLQALDFNRLANLDERLTQFMEINRCMGSFYSQTKDYEVWDDSVFSEKDN